MQYCWVWIRGIKGIYTWHSKDILSVGARVMVLFRERKRIGIIVDVSLENIDFKTKPILEVWEHDFIHPDYLCVARHVADENFCKFEKVFSLMVPEPFFQKQHPEKRAILYFLNKEKQEESELLRGKKQKHVVKLLENKKAAVEDIRKIASLKTLRTLIDKEIIIEEQGSIIDPFQGQRKSRPHFEFTAEQQEAFDLIKKSSIPVLLFGVTGSGKTEIYKKIALDILEKDASAQVLFLLPEIALTPQLIAEFYGLFDDIVAVWHSRLSEGEKVQEFARIQAGEARILVGTRSAVFVPLRNPQLIILDEEHEWTYKNEFMPRFWTHDVAEKISNTFGAKLIFGSATPRIESFNRCQMKEWEKVDLRNRVFKTKLPKIEMIDLKNERKKGNDSPFSERLQERLSLLLKRQRQAVFFLNKRGYAGATLCRTCGKNFHCPDCDNNMKVHKKFDQSKFICHICGHIEKFPSSCPDCRTKSFEFRGWGTQQVEKCLIDMFPGIRVFRADADAVSGKYDFANLMERFHNHEADVLLGTQMVAKGLDFEKVELVGVIMADVGLSLPDFRAEERVFQLLNQVSGRAGRRDRQGEIIIQSFQPNERIFRYLKAHDVEGFISELQKERAEMKHSPFGTIAKLSVSHIDKAVALREGRAIFNFLKECEDSVLEEVFFAPAFFPRTHGKYHFHVFIKSQDINQLIKFLKCNKLPHLPKIDINPISLL